MQHTVLYTFHRHDSDLNLLQFTADFPSYTRNVEYRTCVYCFNSANRKLYWQEMPFIQWNMVIVGFRNALQRSNTEHLKYIMIVQNLIIMEHKQTKFDGILCWGWCTEYEGNVLFWSVASFSSLSYGGPRANFWGGRSRGHPLTTELDLVVHSLGLQEAQKEALHFTNATVSLEGSFKWSLQLGIHLMAYLLTWGVWLVLQPATRWAKFLWNKSHCYVIQCLIRTG